MGHSVIYYGEHDGARTIRSLELGPSDLDWGVVSPEAPERERAAALVDAVAVITNGLSITTEMLSMMPVAASYYTLGLGMMYHGSPRLGRRITRNTLADRIGRTSN